MNPIKELKPKCYDIVNKTTGEVLIHNENIMTFRYKNTALYFMKKINKDYFNNLEIKEVDVTTPEKL